MSSFKKDYPVLHGLFGHVLNIRGWLDWVRMKKQTRSLYQMLARIFVVQKAAGEANPFESALSKYQLSEEELFQQQKGLVRLAWILAVIGFLMLFYGVFSAFHQVSRAVIIACVMGGIALVLSFRYHYWSYLIQIRQLNCPIKEWFFAGLLRKK